MNIIKFGKISIHNFKSVGEEVTLDYRDYPGMTFVKGENLDMPDLANGVGKSVIFVDALLMVLFGQLSNNVKNNEIFYRNAKSNLGWIKLQMFVNDQEWHIHCILQRSKSGNVSIRRSIYKDSVSDDNSRTKSSVFETLKYISEEILKSDADTFKNAVILSTSNIQNFFTLPKPAKEAYLDSVFMLAAFGVVHREIKKNLNSLKKELSSQRGVFQGFKENHDQILEKSNAFIKEKEEEISDFNNRIKTLATEIKSLQKDIESIETLENEIAELESKIAGYNSELTKLEKEREKYTIDEANISTLIDEFSTSVHEKADKKISEIDDQIAELKNKIEEVNKIIGTLEEKINEVGSRKEEIRTIENERIEEASKIAAAKSKVQSELNSMIEVKSQFEETFDLLCKACREKTHEHFKFDQSKYDDLEKKKSAIEELIKQNESKQTASDEDLKKVKSDEAEYSEKISKAKDGIDAIQTKIAEFETSKEAIKKSTTEKISNEEKVLYKEAREEYEANTKENVSRCEELRKSIDAAKDEIRLLQNRISKVESCLTRIDDGTKALKELVANKDKTSEKENPFESLLLESEKKVETAKETIQAILDDQRKYDLLANIFDENGVKKHIVSNIVASLNILIKKYLAEMGTDYIVVFDDKFKYTFYTSTGETDFWTFSSGERRRLDMAVMLSLRDILFTNGLVTNILIVDEVLDSGIDQFALFAILNILKNKTQDADLGCIVISHRSEIFADVTDTFDRVSVVQKHNGQSSIG